MSYNASAPVSMQYRAPGGSTVSPSLTTLAPYNGLESGTIDISAGTVSGVAFPLNFGSVASPTGLLISNTNLYEMALWVQGISANPVHIAPGAVFLIAQPVSCTSVPMSACSIVTTTAQVSAGAVDYIVMGDP
jgi:hypothetical protein